MMMNPHMRRRRFPGYGVRGYGGRRIGGYPGMFMKDRQLGTTMNIPRFGRGGISYMDDPFERGVMMADGYYDGLYDDGWDDYDDIDDDMMSIYGDGPFY